MLARLILKNWSMSSCRARRATGGTIIVLSLGTSRLEEYDVEEESTLEGHVQLQRLPLTDAPVRRGTWPE